MADRTLRVEIVGDASSLNKAFGSATKSSTGLSRAFGNLAKAGALAGVALGALAVVGIKKSIDAASNLEEQINKTNIVFRGSQKQVEEWSKGLEQSFGLSQRAALEAAGTYGNMLVPMGLARDKAAQMSEKMVELAGDMASFNNASPEDTLKAIQSGLAGQARPLRQYGVFLSAARVEQEAMTETGKKSVKQLTEGEKAVARYNLILKDTADTQGDFARSSGSSLENQLRIVKAQFEDLAASIGMAALPAVIRFFRFLSGTLIPALDRAGQVLADFWTSMTNKLGKAPDIRTKVNIVLTGVEGLAAQFVNALVAEIEKLLPQKPIKFVPKIDEPGLSTVGGGVDWNKVAAAMMAALAVAIQQSVALAEALGTAINNAIDKVDWVSAGQKMGPGFAEMLGEAIKTILDPTFWIKNWELTLSIALVAFGGTVEKFAAQIGVKFSGVLVRMIARISPQFAAAFGRLIADAGSVGVVALEKVGNVLFRVAKVIFGRLTRVAVFVVKVLGVQVVISAIEDMISTLKGLFADAGSWLIQTGRDIIAGLKSGISGAWDGFISWLKSLIPDIPGIFRHHLGIGSPSKVMASEVGKPIAEGIIMGYIEGIKDFPNRAKSSMKLAAAGARTEFLAATKVLGRDGALKIVEGFGSQQQSLAQQISTALSSAVKEALAAATQKVKDARSNFASAFASLADAAQSAFDAAMSAWKPPAQKLLDKRALDKQQQDLTDAITKASDDINKSNDALNKALAGGDPAEIASAQQQQIDAQKAYNDALYNQQTFALEQQAALEQANHDKKVAQQKIALKKQLDAVKEWLAKHPGEYQTAVEKIKGILRKFGVDAKFLGSAVGISIAEGLADSEKVVSEAARALMKAISERMKKFDLVIDVTINEKPDTKTDTTGKPRRRFGGPVTAGRQYIVGEAGPELFVPKASGRIIPSMGGGGIGATADIHTHVYLDSTQIAEVVRREYLRFEKRNGRAAV